MKTKNSLFNIDNVQNVVDRLKTELKSPFISVKISTIGGNENVAILVAMSIEPKENWTNGIFSNSNYRRFDISNNGITENFINSEMPKVRKFTAKTVDDLIIRLNKAMIL